MTKRLNQQAASAATGSKNLAAVNAELELHKAKADFLDEALKVSRVEVSAVKGIVEKKRAWLVAAGARLAKLRIHKDAKRALTATCRKKLLQVQKNLATAIEKVKASFARAVEMKKSGTL